MQALANIRVIDVTHALAGPFCTKQLQLLGAEVIKIELPGRGDDFRSFGDTNGLSASAAFIATNAGKKSVEVDLKSPEGRDTIRELVRTADVFVENLRPGAVIGMGLGWSDLQTINPRLIYCSISGFGQTGPMRSWPAYDHTIKAIAGMMWSGEPDDVPDQSRGFSVDCFSGYVAFAAILSGLLRREREGKGQYLDVSMLDSSLVMQSVGVIRQSIMHDNQPAFLPVVHDRPTVGPFHTADGLLWLSVNFQNQWERLCRVIHSEDLIEDPRFADMRARNEHSAELKQILAKRFAPLSAAELEPELMSAGCPAARIRTTQDTVQLPTLLERNMLVPGTVDGREVMFVNAGFTTNVDPPTVQTQVPALGKDNAEILGALTEQRASC